MKQSVAKSVRYWFIDYLTPRGMMMRGVRVNKETKDIERTRLWYFGKAYQRVAEFFPRLYWAYIATMDVRLPLLRTPFIELCDQASYLRSIQWQHHYGCEDCLDGRYCLDLDVEEELRKMVLSDADNLYYDIGWKSPKDNKDDWGTSRILSGKGEFYGIKDPGDLRSRALKRLVFEKEMDVRRYYRDINGHMREVARAEYERES